LSEPSRLKAFDHALAEASGQSGGQMRNRPFLCVGKKFADPLASYAKTLHILRWPGQKLRLARLHESGAAGHFSLGVYFYNSGRGGRVVYRGGLENRWAARSRGFESLPLRHFSPLRRENLTLGCQLTWQPQHEPRKFVCRPPL
jgi:hypothetical protein